MKWVRFQRTGRDDAERGTTDGVAIHAGGETLRFEDVRLLPPCTPTKIVCVGRNYAAHAAELGNEVPERPLLFLKPPSALLGSGEDLILPPSEEVHYEAELAVVIGRRCRNVSAAAARDVILGYTCMNDISDRVAQKWEKSWVRAKAFDGSAPLGPLLVTPDEVTEPFHVRLRLNGETRQDGWTNAFIFTVPELIEEITSFMTLEPGDVIATGTPAGVGRLCAGDVVEVDIEGIGVLRNPVR
ncbi:MAG: fumarylacetoacetate hydrolase family protein [Candidatus Bipolaricaulota bacterium]